MKLPLELTHMSQAPGRGEPVGPGAQAYYLELGELEVWFSYSTPVAFRVSGQDITIRETTGAPPRADTSTPLTPTKASASPGSNLRPNLRTQ